jgi:phosphorylcholine metabolism protein LicD
MDSMTSWILGHTKGDFITPRLLERIAGDFFKPMDRAIARENMMLFKQTMDACQAEFCLFFGTLLGAVREGDFIPHDYDTDVVIMEASRTRLAEAAPRLIEAGFELARCKDHGRFLTFIRKGEYIDINVAKEERRLFRHCWNVDFSLLSYEVLTEFREFTFLGEQFLVPARYEEALVQMYGADWRVPKRNVSAHIPFNIFEPYRTSVILARKYLPRRVAEWLKRLIRRT